MWMDYAYQYSSGGFPFKGTNWKNLNNNWCGQVGGVEDMNGDGRDDLVCHDDRTGKVWVDIYKTSSRFNGLSDKRIPNILSPVWPAGGS